MSGELPQQNRMYSQAELDAVYDIARKDAAADIIKQQPIQQPIQRPIQEETSTVGLDSKFVKQLQNTVGIFNALKEFSSNPLQNAIEQKIGNVAATVVENAFSPRGPPPKKDLIDSILNSQFAYGLGAGIGQRAPELVQTLTSSFGEEKAGNIIDNMMGKYGSGNVHDTKQIGRQDSSEHMKKEPDESANVELLLSLDPNNPEHVAAYAESQGGLSIDVARKMLMIHQDDMIKKMNPQGDAEHAAQTYISRDEQQYQPIVRGQYVEQRQAQEHTEFHNAPTNEHASDIQHTPNGMKQHIGNDQQADMLKAFSNEIGRIIGGMTSQIESLTNTVSSLQSELDTVKRGFDDTTIHPETEIAIPTENVGEDIVVDEVAEVGENAVTDGHTEVDESSAADEGSTIVDIESVVTDENVKIEKDIATDEDAEVEGSVATDINTDIKESIVTDKGFTTVVSRDYVRNKFALSMKGDSNDENNDNESS